MNTTKADRVNALTNLINESIRSYCSGESDDESVAMRGNNVVVFPFRDGNTMNFAMTYDPDKTTQTPSIATLTVAPENWRFL